MTNGFCPKSRQPQFIRLFLLFFLPGIFIGALLLVLLRGAAFSPNVFASEASQTPVITVSAASYDAAALAPGAIAAAFGTQLAARTEVAVSLPLPTTLAGATVRVRDSAGAERLAPLFFVSANQINYLIPPETAVGAATITVQASGATVLGVLEIKTVAPAIFTANSDGLGVPAAIAVRTRPDNSQIFEEVSQFNAALGRRQPRPLDLNAENDRVTLVLFLSGLSRAPDPNNDGNRREAVRVLLGGKELTPAYAGPQGQLAGLDQINVELPRNLLGRGRINLSVVGLTASGAGVSSNLTEIELGPPAGPAPPTIIGFGTANALAGQTLTIHGGGFHPSAANNLIRIGGVEAQVTEATEAQLTVIVPFGVETGLVSARTALGEGRSDGPLPIRTSVSGLVETTERQPLNGVRVRLLNAQINAQTSAGGAFVLPDTPANQPLPIVEIDGGSVPTTPPFGKLKLFKAISADRDNQFERPITLQQITGASAQVGGSAQFTALSADLALTIPLLSVLGAEPATDNALAVMHSIAVLQPATDNKFPSPHHSSRNSHTPPDTAAQPPLSLPSGTTTLELPAGTAVRFPDSATSGLITLTQVENGRTPVNLPPGIFSSTIVQITPFGTTFGISNVTGGKLIFPNSDGLPAGATTKLYRLDQRNDSPTLGKFIEAGAATVSADAQRIETTAGAITEATYYLVILPRQVTTVVGRVVESNGTPVRRALVRLRGQEDFTDGAGGFILRNVPIRGTEDGIVAEASLVRSGGRVDRALSARLNAAEGVTDSGEIVLPGAAVNQAPVILIAPQLSCNAGETRQFNFVASDPDSGQPVTLSISGPNFASIAQTASGPALRLTPTISEAGHYALILTATDRQNLSARREVLVTVQRSNRPPVAISQSFITDEDTPRAVVMVASDPDDDPLNYLIIEPPTRGTLSGVGAARTYTPAKDFNGKDSFTFMVSDGTTESNLATVSLTINAINDPPVLIVPNAQTANAGQLLNFTVSASDVDDGQTLTLSASNIPTGASFNATSGGAAGGQFSWTPTFTQAGNYTVTFVVTDNGAPPTSDVKTVALTVGNVNRPPTANNQGTVTDEDTPKAITLAGSDPEGGQLTFTIIESPRRGSLSGAPPNVTYTPARDYNGADNFTFKVNDGQLDSNTATVSLTINPINDAPVLTVPGAQTGSENQLLSFTISASDVDTGQALTFSAANLPNSAQLNATSGQFTWTPTFTQSGSYTIAFIVTDNGAPALSDTKTVTITVGNANRPPTADAQTVTTDEDTPKAITLTANDPDNDPLTYIIVSQPARGSLSSAGANLTYTPARDYNGADSFTFKVNDGRAESNTATVALTVNPVNDAPVLTVPGTQTVNTNQQLSFRVSATDVDAGQTVTLAATNLPGGATFSPATGQFTWTPGASQAGSYAVRFTATDNGASPLSDTKAVTITVGQVNRPPTAGPQPTVTTNEDTPVNITLSGSDPDGDALSYSIVTPPARGALAGSGASRTYTPASNYNGADSFTFKVSDGRAESNTVAVEIRINPVNDAPVLTVPGPQTVSAGQQLNFTVMASDVDAGQTLRLAAANVPTGASFNAATGLFTWTPTAAPVGTYTVTFTVTDNGTPALSDSEQVRISVVATNSTVHGTVRNAATGQPLANALLAIAGTNLTAVSANDGSYALNNVPPGGRTLTAAATGFAATQITVNVVAGETLTQNLSLSPSLGPGQLRITLNWAKDANGLPDDLDAHLNGPAANNQCFHVFFENQGALNEAPFSQLEVDNVKLAGHPPTETIRIGQLFAGTYRFYIHDFEGKLANGLTRARATIQVYNSSGLQRTYFVPNGAGRYWHVFEINGQNGEIRDVNQLAETPPSTACAGVCTYALTPANRTIPASGGTGSSAVATQLNCRWTAVSNVPWLTITGGASGYSNGTVSYAVASLSGTSSRSGTLSIGGQTFTVTQTAATTPGGLQVVDNKVTGGPFASSGCAPPPIRNSFLTTDATAYQWTHLRNFVNGDILRWEFVQPSGAVYSAYNMTLGTGGEGCYRMGMVIARDPAANLPGAWRVRVLHRGNLVVTENFTINR